jgi:hypothetical protein
MSRLPVFFVCIFISINATAQINDFPDSIAKPAVKNLTFKTKQLIIPAAFLTYGIVALESDYLKDLNTELRNELKENIDEKASIDDYSQYAPALAVYGLNIFGIKGKNSLADRSIILGTAYLFMSTSVLSLKKITRIERPDGSSRTSFPSGHTATAFMAAEFLWQEYKDVSPWYGVAGFVVATGTGFYRIYNARHWISDVIMGAGIGILSTKAAYWTFPFVKNKIFRSKKNTNVIMPFYNGKQQGITMIVNFK